MKLTRYLLRVTRDGKYGDSMERVMYNTVLGARPLTGRTEALTTTRITTLRGAGCITRRLGVLRGDAAAGGDRLRHQQLSAGAGCGVGEPVYPVGSAVECWSEPNPDGADG